MSQTTKAYTGLLMRVARMSWQIKCSTYQVAFRSNETAE